MRTRLLIGSLVASTTALAFAAGPAAAAGPAPTANPDTASVGAASLTARGNVLTNDLGPDGGPATIGTVLVDTTPTTKPGHGTAAISADGSFVYTPSPCFTGTDRFGYRIASADDPTATATSTVTVTVGAFVTGVQGGSVTVNASGRTAVGNLLSRACGISGKRDAASLQLVTDSVSKPGKGRLVFVHADGGFRYEAAKGAKGTDSFTFQVRNPKNPTHPGLVATGTVTIRLGGAPDLVVSIAKPAGLDVGKRATATFTVRNAGNQPTVDPTTLTITLPRFVHPTTQSLATANCRTHAGQQVLCPVPAGLAPAKAVAFRLDLEVEASIPPNTTLKPITASIAASDDARPVNDAASTGGLGIANAQSSGNAGGSGGGGLPATGVSNVGLMVGIGAVLLALGAALLFLSRRRRA